MLKPQDITIIVDSREQTPLYFKIKEFDIPTEIGTLQTGDYSVKGLESKISVERKSLNDLLGCIGKDRERFEKELERMAAFETRALVIESTWEHIERGKFYKSQVHPNAVIGSLLAWQERYSIPIMMCVDHKRAGLMTARLLFSAVNRRYVEYCKIFNKKFKG